MARWKDSEPGRAPRGGLGRRADDLVRIAERQAAALIRAARKEAEQITSAARADAAALRATGSPAAGAWPADWDALVRGTGCAMCGSARPESDDFGVRVHASEYTDAYLQRANVQRGYTVVIWRGRHVCEPTELTDEEAAAYWRDVLTVARALTAHYRPLKMNYETLGNSLPHLHTHLVPRYRADPAPGRPFPMTVRDPREPQVPEGRLQADAAALRSLLARSPGTAGGDA